MSATRTVQPPGGSPRASRAWGPLRFGSGLHRVARVVTKTAPACSWDRKTKLLVGLGLNLVVLTALALLLAMTLVGHATWTIRVKGQLVDGDGRPVAATPVMTLPDESWLERSEDIERRRTRYQEIEQPRATFQVAVGRTGADGSFDLSVVAPWGPTVWRPRPPPYYWTRLLRVETSEGPVHIDCTKGVWTIRDRWDVTLDLGTIALK